MDTLENTSSSDRLRRAMFISIIVWMFWIMFLTPRPVPQQNVTKSDSQGVVLQQEDKNVVNSTTDETKKVSKKAEIPPHYQDFVDENIRSKISSKNGGISSIALLNFSELPVNNPWWSWIFSGEGEWEPYLKGSDTLPISTENSGFILAGAGRPSTNENFNIKTTNSDVVAISSLGGIVIKKNYSKTEDPYVYKVDVSFTNNSGRAQEIWLGITDKLEKESGRFYDELRPQFYTNGIDTYTDISSLDKKPKGEELPPYWFGLGSRYFLVAASEFNKKSKDINNSKFSRVEARSFGNDEYGAIAYFKEPLADGATENISMTLYIGPKELDRLANMSNEWSRAVDFGFFGFFSRVLLFILKIIYAGVANWGLAIILLTIVVKVIFYPMTQKAFESGRKMQMLQPELNEIKEKYKDDKMLQSQETMKLFQKHKVSPAGGCLPTLIQLPVWFALYNALLYSVELYDSSFLYLEDLTSPDPYGVLPVMYGILMFGSQKLMRPSNQGEVSEQQAMMMKMMKYMTVMFTIFMFTFPSGLVIYFCCNMLLSTLQQFLIKKRLDGDSLAPVSEKG